MGAPSSVSLICGETHGDERGGAQGNRPVAWSEREDGQTLGARGRLGSSAQASACIDGGSWAQGKGTRVGGDMEVTPEYTRACLTRWGQWLRQGGGGAAGFAASTVEGRLMRDGTLIRGIGRVALSEDSLAERVDRMVARLAQDDRRWPLMMRVYWGSEHGTYEVAAVIIGDHYGERVSPETVRRWMREATATVRGELRGCVHWLEGQAA